MKFIIGIITLGLVAMSQQVALHHIRFPCLATSLANPATVVKVRNGDFSIDDPRVKKYAYCVYNAIHLVTPDGKINKQAGLKHLDPQTNPDKFSAAVDACNDMPGSSVEDTFWNVLVCYNEQYPGDIYAL